MEARFSDGLSSPRSSSITLATPYPSPDKEEEREQAEVSHMLHSVIDLTVSEDPVFYDVDSDGVLHVVELSSPVGSPPRSSNALIDLTDD